MTAAVETENPAETFVQDEIAPPTLLELRRAVHCSIERRSQVEHLLADFAPVASKLASENKAEVRKGVGMWALGRVEEAVRVLEPSRQSKERSYVLGLCYLEVGRPNDALAQLKEAAEAAPDDLQVKLASLEARLKVGLFDEAEKMFGQLAKKLDGSADYHYLRGLSSDLQGFFSEAGDAYERALELEPGHARSLFRLAHMLDLHGDDARAVELYEQLRKLRPCHVNTMINLGTIYEDRGDYERAAECYRAVLDYYPNHARAKLYYRDAVASSSMFYDEDAARREAKIQQILSQPVAEISCSPRVRAALQRLNVTTLGDLAQKTEEDLLGLPNFGRTSLRELREILTARGLNLAAGEGAAPSVLPGEEAPAAAPIPGGTPSEEAQGKNLAEMDWSGRIQKLIEKLGFVTVGDLLKVSEAELLKNKNLGMTSIKEIRKKLGQFGVAMREE